MNKEQNPSATTTKQDQTTEQTESVDYLKMAAEITGMPEIMDLTDEILQQMAGECEDDDIDPMGLQSKTLLQLMEICDKSLSNCSLSAESISDARPALARLAQRLNITEDEAMWLSAIFNQGGFYNIDFADLCRYFKCRPIQALQYKSLFDTLVQKEFLRPTREEREHYDIPDYVVNAIGQNQVPCPAQYKNLTIDQWLDALYSLLDARRDGNIAYDCLAHRITDLFNDNPQLPIVQHINNYALGAEERIILLVTLSQFVEDNDERIGDGDFHRIFERDNRMQKSIVRRTTTGKGILFASGILEYNNSDGLLDLSSWHLSDRTKEELLNGTDFYTVDTKKKPVGLIESATIKSKQLFYNSQVTKQVLDLQSILSKERFQEVQDRLTEKGMRKGFACIFYGAPGTGKTETVLQLARQTGRDIMQVDMSKLRNAYVGESEKRVKAVFDKYRNLCNDCDLTPILLFNEADAILGKRNSDAEKAVDKMENAIQNIILQELENLDGIMIATTNLTSNLDEAFERRFLYKIEFPRPTPNESKHIWQAMLPELTDTDALLLAKRFAFSGGQIENIARKQTIHTILYRETANLMDSIIEACLQEKLGRTEHAQVGFC